MDEPVASKVINDRRGDAHNYTLCPTPAGEALDMTPELLTLGGPVIDAIQAALGSNATFSDALDKMAGLVLKMGGHKKAIKILKYTKRDGMSIKSVSAFNMAYTHNLAECVTALRWVIGETYGDFFGGASGLIGPELTNIIEQLKSGGLDLLRDFTKDLTASAVPAVVN